MSWTNSANSVDRLLRSIGRPRKDRVEQAWKKLEESRHADLEGFSNGELVIKVKNSAKLQLLNFKKDEIIKKMNDSLEEKVNNVRFKLGG